MDDAAEEVDSRVRVRVPAGARFFVEIPDGVIEELR